MNISSSQSPSASRGRGRPRKSQSPPGHSKRHVLAVAARLFAERGFADVSLAEIARESGVDRAAVYYLFGDKLSVVRALGDELLAPLVEYQAELNGVDGDPPSPTGRLAAYLTFEIGVLAPWRDVVAALLTAPWLRTDEHVGLWQVLSSLDSELARWCRDAQQASEFDESTTPAAAARFLSAVSVGATVTGADSKTVVRRALLGLARAESRVEFENAIVRGRRRALAKLRSCKTRG